MQATHSPLVDLEVKNYLDQTLRNTSLKECEESSNNEFISTFRAWLESSNHNNIDLTGFEYGSFIYGTISGWPEFLVRNHNRRIRSSTADFVMTKVLSKKYGIRYMALEEAPLESGDALIISHPFAGNGSTLPNLNLLLDQADVLGVPTMMDCAYFGISHNVSYPLHHQCVTDLVFSLSKNYGTSKLRFGARFTRDKRDDGLTAGLFDGDIYNKHGATITNKLLKKFSHDWFIKKWKDKSIDIANDLNLLNTNCLTLKTANRSLGKKYERGTYVRVCISQELFEKN